MMRESTRQLDQIERLLQGLSQNIQERRESDEQSDDALRSEIIAQAEAAGFLADRLGQLEARIEAIERLAERRSAADERAGHALRTQITRQLELTSDALRRMERIEGALRTLEAPAEAGEMPGRNEGVVHGPPAPRSPTPPDEAGEMALRNEAVAPEPAPRSPVPPDEVGPTSIGAPARAGAGQQARRGGRKAQQPASPAAEGGANSKRKTHVREG